MKGKKIMAFGEETCSDIVQIHDLSCCLALKGVCVRAKNPRKESYFQGRWEKDKGKKDKGVRDKQDQKINKEYYGMK